MRTSNQALPGLLAALLLSGASQAAVQTFVDERDPGPSLPPVMVSATLTDPYPTAKPIQHAGYADFGYWYTAGPDWRNSTAVVDDGFTASLAFKIDSTDPAHTAISLQTGFMIDRPDGATTAALGRLQTTLRFFDSQAQLVTTYAVSDLLSDPFIAGYSHAVGVPVSLGQAFTVEASFHIEQQGQYVLPGSGTPLNDRYLFNGFAVSTTPVPEPQALALILGGLLTIGVGLSAKARRARRVKQRSWLAMAGAMFAGALATPAHADDTLIASATLQVSGLKYRLIDLDLNDGITPWVTFTNATNTQVELREPGAADIKQTFAGIFPAPFTVTSASGLAQVQRTNDGFTVHNELRRSDLDNTATWPSTAGEFLAQRVALLGIDGQSASLTLSPHTQLVIEGWLTATVTLDMSSLTNHGLIQNPAGHITGLHGRSTLYFFHSAFDEGGLLPMDEGSGHLSLQQDVTASGAGLEELDDAMPETLSFGLSNTLGVSVQGRVAWGASLYTDVSGTVPEPGVIGLALAGLMVLGSGRLVKKPLQKMGP